MNLLFTGIIGGYVLWDAVSQQSHVNLIIGIIFIFVGIMAYGEKMQSNAKYTAKRLR